MKFLLAIFSIYASLSLCAQTNDNSWKRPSWWNERVGQINQDTVTEAGNSIIDVETNNLISSAISPSLAIVRQQYQLERNGDYFGKNNLPYYGETYSLGIKTSGGMLLMDQVLHPWNFDKDYEKVNSSKKYNPALFLSFQRILTDSIYRPVDLELGSKYVTSINEDSNLYYHEEPRCDFGLNIDNGDGNRSGYIIWAYSDKNLTDSTMSISLKCIPYKETMDRNRIYKELYPVNPEMIIGGLFIVPSIETGGRIKLQLGGMAVKQHDNKWSMQFFGRSSDNVAYKPEGNPESKAAKEKRDSSKP